ncbi:Argininosuccinate lyase [Methanimicrococcus hongohii]|uniref:Argininosuccinate lyase n=1 Tax=Methanimicrococcus hongohii TaxID=3028295 RepID=A0AA96V028_9EURY|nr:argininosuccinate lyase [Methanimicrococcus sp. Hf6]WNY23278.1 Argininosuccinate lyase [Methanimicrococcus sp. Hf6]
MSDILRRGRLSKNPGEEMRAYTSSMEADEWIFEADVYVDMAHTLMLHEQEIISADDCSKILFGLLQIKEEGMEMLDFSYEDIHISLESRLIDIIGEEAGGRMHSGRSRNDEVATCIRFALRSELLSMLEDLMKLENALTRLASDHFNTLMPGFTHLQHAQPTTFAHHLTAHADAIERDIFRIISAYGRVNICPLGSAAFASTGFPIDRYTTAERLGFSAPMTNSMDAVSSRDFLIECAAAFSNIMINLSRMAEELILWSSQEFNFIELDDAYASTSSIMPQKKNPDTAELMRGKSGTVVGSLSALLTICKGLPLSYNRDLQEATPHIIKSAHVTAASVRMMTGIMETLTVHEDVMKEKAVEGFTTATELADTMVRDAGIPFRTAHQIVGTLSKTTTTPSLNEIDSVSTEVLGYKLSDKGLTEEAVAGALDPMSNVKRRAVIGGPAPTQMRDDLSDKKKRLSALQKQIWDMDLAVEKALENLTEEVKKAI